MIMKTKLFRRSLISASTPDKVVDSMRWKLKASLETGSPPNTQGCEYRADRGTAIAAADAGVMTLSFGWPRHPLTSSQIAAQAISREDDSLESSSIRIQVRGLPPVNDCRLQDRRRSARGPLSGGSLTGGSVAMRQTLALNEVISRGAGA